MTHKYIQKILDKKESHKQKNTVFRILIVILGFFVLISGLPFLVIFPELGIPLILIGLAILALEYSWAGSILSYLSKQFDRFLLWLRKQPKIFHIILSLVFLGIGIFILYLIFR